VWVWVWGSLAAVSAQDISFEPSENLEAPHFNARFSLGFNYDLLRFPDAISFQEPVGYAGFNIPLHKTVNILDVARIYSDPIDSIFADTLLFADGEEFQPTATAAQRANTTFRVEVPMLKGAGYFAHTENFYMSYSNTLGMPGAKLSESLEEEGITLFARGAIDVPVAINASWNTMAFGYAYRINRELMCAFHLYRHLFMFDARASVNTDLLGYADIDQEQLNMRLPLDYSDLGGYLNASYSATCVTPSFAVKWWRFGLTSRFGFSTVARGHMQVNYEVPFFIDQYTFQTTMTQQDLTDPSYINKLKENRTNTFTTDPSVENNDIEWEMPGGHTLSFDILRDNLRLSWTKIDGPVRMKRDNIWINEVESRQETGVAPDTIDFDLRIDVDHVIMLNCRFYDAFLNAGVFAFDVSYGDQTHILTGAVDSLQGALADMKLAGQPIFPIVNLGAAVGTRVQLLMELHIAPLPAAKTGVRYYF
jgi:hypothetical protein